MSNLRLNILPKKVVSIILVQVIKMGTGRLPASIAIGCMLKRQATISTSKTTNDKYSGLRVDGD